MTGGAGSVVVRMITCGVGKGPLRTLPASQESAVAAGSEVRWSRLTKAPGTTQSQRSLTGADLTMIGVGKPPR